MTDVYKKKKKDCFWLDKSVLWFKYFRGDYIKLPEPDPKQKRPKGHAIRLSFLFLRGYQKVRIFGHSVKPTAEEGEDDGGPSNENENVDRLLQVRDNFYEHQEFGLCI